MATQRILLVLELAVLLARFVDEHLERGWVKVHAGVVSSTKYKRLRIDVSDSGIGIAEDRLAMIFEQFTQADGSTARKYGGTGLGLSISSQLARMMGGEITVRSIVGEGTIFSVELPLTESAEALVREDDQCDPANAITVVRKLIHTSNVFAIVGGSCLARVVGRNWTSVRS